MRVLDVFILLVLFAILGISLFLLWSNIPNLPGQQASYKEFNLDKEKSGGLGSKSVSQGIQFYPSMRYRDKVISYSISDLCERAKRNDVERAFSYISDVTILRFKESPEGEITILCSNVSPKPEEEGHFVAGEGGPSEIINTSNYALIFSGKVALYRRAKECVKPNVAIHEILHALGFDHNNNQNSVMYPLTECEQTIDSYIINEINRLYSTDSLPDLAIENIIATKIGRYINFNITIGNFGLQDSLNSSLLVYADDSEVGRFSLEKINVGSRKILTVQNLKGPLRSDNLVFEVIFNGKELDKENNKASLKLEKVEDS